MTNLRPALFVTYLVLVLQVHNHVVTAGQRPAQHPAVGCRDFDWWVDLSHFFKHRTSQNTQAIEWTAFYSRT